MRKGLVILVALSIALLMGSSMLLAQEKAPVEKAKGTCKKEMKLTDEQKAKIDEMKTNLRLKMIDLKAEREKLAIALKTEMKKPEPSMQEIEAIVKKLSAVREKMQLAAIEHRLAMRKLVGEEGCRMMMGEPGMAGCGEEREGFGGEKSCGMNRNPRMGMHEGRGMHAPHMMVVKTDGSGCTMEMGAPGAGCGMHAMAADCCKNASKADCMIMMKKGHACNHPPYGNWHHKMFRPFGKAGCCPGMHTCTMEMGGMKGGCKMKQGAMKGCCSMEQGAMKGGCMMGKGGAEGCMKKCAEKEIKCTVEVKEKEEPKK